MDTLGQHIIAEFYECDSNIISSVEQVRKSLLNTANLIGTKIVQSHFHQFLPQGVSGVLVIAESHIAVHTWPESNYVAIDFYTCGNIDPIHGCKFLAEYFSAKEYRFIRVIRGIPKDISHIKEDPSTNTLNIANFPSQKFKAHERKM